MMQGFFFLSTGVIGVHHDIIAVAVGGEESDYGAGGHPFFADDFFQHVLRVLKQLSGFNADDFVIEYFGVASGHFPGLEKRRPVDVPNQRIQRKVVDDLDALECRFNRLVVTPVEFIAPGVF